METGQFVLTKHGLNSLKFIGLRLYIIKFPCLKVRHRPELTLIGHDSQSQVWGSISIIPLRIGFVCFVQPHLFIYQTKDCFPPLVHYTLVHLYILSSKQMQAHLCIYICNPLPTHPLHFCVLLKSLNKIYAVVAVITIWRRIILNDPVS